jgi:hypothetical protein
VSSVHALRIELRILFELYLIPGVCVFMPWPIGYRWLRLCSRWRWLFQPEWQAALASARSWLDIADEKSWARSYRIARLVDHADYWLSRTRSRRWLTRHVDMPRDWPLAERAAVGVFFHWCGGMWAIRALSAAGPSSAVLAGHYSKRAMGHSWLGYFYGFLRLSELARAGGRPLIFSPGSVNKAQAELAAGHWVTGTPDVPPTETRLARPVSLFGRPAQFTEGLLRIARDAEVPVVMFTLGLDLASGRRDLRIEGPFDAHDPELLQRIASYWEALIREKPWGFTLWPMMPAYFLAATEGGMQRRS